MDTKEPNANPDNVTPLGKKSKKKGLSQADMFSTISDRINRFPTAIEQLHFPEKYLVFADDMGCRAPLSVFDDRVVKFVHIDHVAHAILAFATNYEDKLHYGFVPKSAKECARHWLSITKPFDVDTIKPIAELSENCYTYNRLPWNLADGLTPLWDEILSRMSDPNVFMAFVGSLLFAEADRQQYCWLYGEGLNSKGTILRFLSKVAGPAYRSETAPKATPGNFWTSNLVGARLVAFPDCDVHNFVTTGLFKSLSGGDAVRVEFKNGGTVSAEMVAKFAFCSNIKPEISGSKADRRRALLHEMSEVPSARMRAGYELDRDLWDEGAAFLFKCRAAYLEQCPNHEAIVGNSDKIDEIISSTEEAYHVIANRYFDVAPYEQGGSTGRMREFAFTSSREMQEIFKLEKIFSRPQQGQFIGYLQRQWNVKRISVHLEGTTREWRYMGISVKDIMRTDNMRGMGEHSQQRGHH